MNRRRFATSITASLLGVPALMARSHPSEALAIDATDAPRSIPFQLSVMLWTVYRDLPFEQRLEKVAEAGYKNVELVGEYAKWSNEDFDRANAARKRLGITFDCTAGVKHELSNPRQRDAFVAELRATLPTMERLECPAIILLSGNVVPGMSEKAQTQSCVDGLKAAVATVEGKRINGQAVRLLLENIDPEENPKYFLTSVARGFEIVQAVNHPQVQLCYDLFHEQIAEGNLIEKLEKNIERVGLIHVADVPGRHIPGTGEINYPNIFRKLVELNYKHVVAMEFLPTGDPVAELRQAKSMATASSS